MTAALNGFEVRHCTKVANALFNEGEKLERENAELRELAERMAEALSISGDTFRLYEKDHRQKGTSIAEDRAHSNSLSTLVCEKALTAYRRAFPNQTEG